jgi:hypothetical protein
MKALFPVLFSLVCLKRLHLRGPGGSFLSPVMSLVGIKQVLFRLLRLIRQIEKIADTFMGCVA